MKTIEEIKAMLEEREKEHESHDDWHKKYMDTQLKTEIRLLKEILGEVNND